jgi:hypothetical protein
MAFSKILIEPILNNIVEFCDYKDALNFKRACKLFYRIYKTSNAQKKVYIRDNFSYIKFLNWVNVDYNSKNIVSIVFGKDFCGFLNNPNDTVINTIESLSVSNSLIQGIYLYPNIKKLAIEKDFDNDQNLSYDFVSNCINIKELTINSIIFYYKYSIITDLGVHFPNLEKLYIGKLEKYPITTPSFRNLPLLKTLEIDYVLKNNDALDILYNLPDSLEYLKLNMTNRVFKRDTIITQLPKKLKTLNIDFRFTVKGLFKIPEKKYCIEINDDINIYLNLF